MFIIFPGDGMEYFYLAAASILSGMGTGFVGISTATVLVPVLIVLCPSFRGDGGVYAAQTVALSCDIISGALTSFLYIRHKNINLRKGWIMLVSVSLMSALGSRVAYMAGNEVLGTFSLFLSLFIGLRFLFNDGEIKKDTPSPSRLTARHVLISLFFGLTIGFGTGFAGTGGGMMMLVVFTLFLGLDLKSSVGNVTLIMAVTASAAAVSRFIYSPDILKEHCNALLISIPLTTISAAVSAVIANRVKERTSYLSAGIILTLLSASMIILSYRDLIAESSFIMSMIECIIEFSEYIFFGALVLVIIFVLFRNFPKDVFRKLLHFVAFTSLVEMTLIADTWYYAMLTTALFASAVYPVLGRFETKSWYSSLFVEKKKGEIKKSLVLFFGMYALLIGVCWGLFGKRNTAIVSFLMWGVGDAAAALIGRRFGRHRVKLKYADRNKSWEGSSAMLLSSFLIGAAGMLLSGETMWYRVVFHPLIAAPFAAYTELVSRNGNDTVTVPVVTAAVLLILSYIF